MKLFKTFRLDTANHLLWREGERVPLAPKGFDVLAYLVEHAGRVVTQDEILEALWPETYVNPEVLRKYILEIRKALGDRPDNPEFVETVPKRGYRFVAPVLEESTVEPPVAEASAAMEQPATEENAGPATATSEEESPSGRYRLWKFAVLPTLLVLAAVLAPTRAETLDRPIQERLPALQRADQTQTDPLPRCTA
jgi:DNA-binding winged helix-turn-helix (wHTH) protein